MATEKKLTGWIKQQWREGIVHTRTRSAEWILKNFVQTDGQSDGQWNDSAFEYAFSTEHTWLDAERPNRVCWLIPGLRARVEAHIDQTSAREAIEQMLAVEKMFAKGLTAQEVYDKVEVV